MLIGKFRRVDLFTQDIDLPFQLSFHNAGVTQLILGLVDLFIKRFHLAFQLLILGFNALVGFIRLF